MKIIYDYIYITVVSGGIIPPFYNYLRSHAYEQFYEQGRKSEERIVFLLNNIFWYSVADSVLPYASLFPHSIASVDQ
jgi:hypothetical protein